MIDKSPIDGIESAHWATHMSDTGLTACQALSTKIQQLCTTEIFFEEDTQLDVSISKHATLDMMVPIDMGEAHHF